MDKQIVVCPYTTILFKKKKEKKKGKEGTTDNTQRWTSEA